MNDEKPSQPLWETLVMIGSFGLLWVWFLVRQKTLQMPGASMPLWCNAMLIISAVALIIVTVRRMKRVKRALEEEIGPDAQRNRTMPWMNPPGAPPHQSPPRESGKKRK